MFRYKKRLSALRQEFRKKKAGAFITNQPVNIRYLTGFSGSSGWLIVSDDKVFLYVDSRYTEQANKEAGPVCRVTEWKGPEAKLWECIRRDFKTKSWAFEGDGLTVDRYKILKNNLSGKTWINCGSLVKRLRSIKDADEINKIKKAVDIAEKAFQEVCLLIKPGIRESDIALELEYHLRKAGAEKAAFEIIVLFGQRSSLPHGKPTGKKINYNTIMLIDFGAVYGGYHSDLTRIVALGRMPSNLKSLFSIVLEAKELGISAIKPGCSAKDVDQKARDFIKSQGCGDFFGHGLGHGLGLEIHEFPVLSPLSEDRLAPGMVVTVEPGIYRPGWGGIRIEEDCLVTKSGCTVLTRPQTHVIELN